jgi:hypothetical protein
MLRLRSHPEALVESKAVGCASLDHVAAEVSKIKAGQSSKLHANTNLSATLLVSVIRDNSLEGFQPRPIAVSRA